MQWLITVSVVLNSITLIGVLIALYLYGKYVYHHYIHIQTTLLYYQSLSLANMDLLVKKYEEQSDYFKEKFSKIDSDLSMLKQGSSKRPPS